MKQHKKNGGITPKYIFLALLAVCCILIAVSFMWGSTTNNIVQKTIGTVIVPMQKGLNSIGYWISSKVENSKTVSELKEENEALQLQVDTLKAQISSMENNLAELDTLRDMLSLKEKYPNYNMVGARIISSDAGNWYDTFTIDKGSLDGIKVDMNVIADNGLVGIVIETGLNHSKVRAITDDSSSVSAQNASTKDPCIVNGSLKLKDTGLLEVELIKADAQMAEGDAIETSHLSDLFLPGLPIGFISNVTQDSSTLTQKATVTPIVDFEHLTDVLVITQLKQDLITDEDTGDNAETETKTNTQPDSLPQTTGTGDGSSSSDSGQGNNGNGSPDGGEGNNGNGSPDGGEGDNGNGSPDGGEGDNGNGNPDGGQGDNGDAPQ